MFEMVSRIRCPPLVDPPLWLPPLVHAVASSATAAMSPISILDFRIYLSLPVRSAIRYASGASAQLSLPEIRGGAQGRALKARRERTRTTPTPADGEPQRLRSQVAHGRTEVRGTCRTSR